MFEFVFSHKLLCFLEFLVIGNMRNFKIYTTAYVNVWEIGSGGFKPSLLTWVLCTIL